MTKIQLLGLHAGSGPETTLPIGVALNNHRDTMPLTTGVSYQDHTKAVRTKNVQEENMASVSKCSTCGVDVRSDDKALLCDICETWEHHLRLFRSNLLSH